MEGTDIELAETLARHRRDPAIGALGRASEIADQLPAVAVCGALLAGGLATRRPRAAEAGARMLASVLVAAAIKAAVKAMVARSRPHVLLEQGRYGFGTRGPGDGDWRSFPSGHTADAVAAARGLVRTFPGAALPAYGVAAAIGAVQVPRAKHYPSDVAAGAVVGIAAELIVRFGGFALLAALPGRACPDEPEGRRGRPPS